MWLVCRYIWYPVFLLRPAHSNLSKDSSTTLLIPRFDFLLLVRCEKTALCFYELYSKYIFIYIYKLHILYSGKQVWMCLHGITVFTNCSLLEINVCKYFLGTLLVVCKQFVNSSLLRTLLTLLRILASCSKNTSGGKLYHEFNEGQSQVRGLAWFPNSKIIKLFWFAEECSKAENGAITIFSKHASHNLTHHNFTGALSPKCGNLPPKHLNVCLIRVHGFCLLEVLYDRRFKQQPAVEDTCFYDIFRSMFEEIEEIPYVCSGVCKQ